MSRLAATLQLDVRNQYRQGFYAASLVVLLILGAVLGLAPRSAGFVLSAILLTNMVIATFGFLAGLLLIEKGERTLEGLVVSPLRPEEYLLSKVGTLTALATLENVVIVEVALAVHLVTEVRWGWVLAGSLLSAVVYALLGFLLVIRYRSISELLLPMVGATSLLELPALVAFGMPHAWWLFLLPTYGPMLMFQVGVGTATGPAEALAPGAGPSGVLAYVFLYSMLWVGAAFWRGRSALVRFVAGDIGSR